MKLHSLILVFAFVLTGSVFAQRQMLSPEQRTQQLKDSLALTEEQATKILILFQELEVERRQLFESENEDRQSRMQMMRSLGEKTDAKIEELLTAEQKEKYSEMRKRRQERMGGMRRRD